MNDKYTKLLEKLDELEEKVEDLYNGSLTYSPNIPKQLLIDWMKINHEELGTLLDIMRQMLKEYRKEELLKGIRNE